MQVSGPLSGVEAKCEALLRTLPRWFGIEESLLAYSRDTAHLPTFGATQGGEMVGFITLREHFPQAWEVHCIAVAAERRGQGIGRALHEHASLWVAKQGAQFLQVKTLAAAHPSPEYAETREFYTALGYTPLEVFPLLWSEQHPVLQLVKVLKSAP
jgi:GNAT superfamily N-acetyltransferase